MRFLTTAILAASSLFALPNLSAETLKEALASAYLSHPQLKAERERVREFDEGFVQAASQGRFQANTSASAGLSRVSGVTQSTNFFGQTSEVDFSQNTSPRSLSVTGQKLLYDGGRVRSLKGQAKYGILAAREQLRNVEQSILLETATAYADVLRDEEAARIRRNNVNVLSRQRDAAQDRFDVGVGTRTDIAQADARLAQAEIGLSQAEAQLQASRAAYERATGHFPVDLQPIENFPFPDSLAKAQALGLTRNPQMEAARYNEDAARFGVDIAKATGGATVNAQTFVQRSLDQGGQILEQDAIGVSVNLTIPLFTGGLNDSRVRQATAQKNRTHFEVRATENALKERIAALWAQMEAAEISVEASQRQVAAAEVAFEGVQIELEVGTRDSLDVLNAEQEVLNARLNLAQARRDLVVIKFQILSLVGMFDAATLGLDIAYYDPRENFDEVTDWDFFAPAKEAIDSFPISLPSKEDIINEVSIPFIGPLKDRYNREQVPDSSTETTDSPEN